MNIPFYSTLEIISNDINYFTHGFFKYPCKFIPHIPRWAIIKYTEPGDFVLDSFAGSGTTLVEAIVHERIGLGVDFDRFSQLLCKTKTTLLTNNQINYLQTIKDKLFYAHTVKKNFEPDLINVNHWFDQKNLNDLLNLRRRILDIYKESYDEQIYNFLLVCFASIIRKCSYADDVSPKPYVSSRISKQPLDVKNAFFKTFESYISRIEQFKTNRFFISNGQIKNENIRLGKAFIIADDARAIMTHKYDGKVSLAVTSPPYINAFDYVRSLRLENSLLGFYGDSNVIEMKKKQIGTETISSNEYKNNIKNTGYKNLDRILKIIYEKDKRRSYVIFRFFDDLTSNLKEVKRLLKRNSHYVIVIGDSFIRNVNVPTHEILIEIAKNNGYELHTVYSYIIKNRYLRIPRSGKGGLIKKDWVIDLVSVS